MRIRFLILISVAIVGISNRSGAGECPQFFNGQEVGTIAYGEIDEASGIAVSKKNPDVFWTHNDDGPPHIFAFNSKGKHLGVYSLVGANNRDWEDIAIGPGPDPTLDYIYVGDIGDNGASYPSVNVYRVPEPDVDPEQGPVNLDLNGVETITLEYPGGPRDAETLLVDPNNGDIFIVTKRNSPSEVYRAAYPQSTTQTITMAQVATIEQTFLTAGEISLKGDLIILRGYISGYCWRRSPGTNLWDAFSCDPCQIPIIGWPVEPQGEAIGFDADGCGYFTISEGLGQKIYYFARDGSCPLADIDDDGLINIKDLALLGENWLAETGEGDFNGDGLTEGQDLVILLDDWLWYQRWP